MSCCDKARTWSQLYLRGGQACFGWEFSPYCDSEEICFAASMSMNPSRSPKKNHPMCCSWYRSFIFSSHLRSPKESAPVSRCRGYAQTLAVVDVAVKCYEIHHFLMAWSLQVMINQSLTGLQCFSWSWSNTIYLINLMQFSVQTHIVSIADVLWCIQPCGYATLSWHMSDGQNY